MKFKNSGEILGFVQKDVLDNFRKCMQMTEDYEKAGVTKLPQIYIFPKIPKKLIKEYIPITLKLYEPE